METRSLESQSDSHSQPRRNRRGFNMKKRRKVLAYVARNRHPDHITGDSESDSPSREAIKLMPKPPFLAAQKYMASPVVALITLKYQGNAEGLFEKNPAPTWCFLGATFVYWLIVEGMKHMPTPEYRKCLQILSRAALASGVLSSVSLVSIFLPPHLSFVPLIIWTVVQPVVLAWPLLHRASNWLHKGITTVVHKIRAKVVWGARSGCNLTVEESLPV